MRKDTYRGSYFRLKFCDGFGDKNFCLLLCDFLFLYYDIRLPAHSYYFETIYTGVNSCISVSWGRSKDQEFCIGRECSLTVVPELCSDLDVDWVFDWRIDAS